MKASCVLCVHPTCFCITMLLLSSVSGQALERSQANQAVSSRSADFQGLQPLPGLQGRQRRLLWLLSQHKPS